ncbi:monooxygenase [Pseudomonas aeruginosa]|jgi:phenol hydroxylase P2 protein|uniref:Phenol hydroxylase component PheM n=1 Tax=Stutzerimonas stutzeri TaxID=316 RepID=Q84AQ3_STUST|nr:MmoB/DmpM family protein [Pseudomonas aeruginosa]AAO47357.1 phenol hydroxylase component phM [Pseudomonas sp. OX1]ALP69197.1 phenol hydroxylase component PheM [Stutzerimonas stutzeri]RUI12872.1 monooxygenase [Pseudomonas aeruginosa]2INP_L Chain L, Phenol hydroxylase component phM [Stutzerimonas stutzeri]
MSQLVFIVFQDNDDSRYLAEAVMEDNPDAEMQHQPAMIRIQAEKRLVINRETMEEKLGRDWDVQEMLINVISIAGNVDEDDDHFILEWN